MGRVEGARLITRSGGQPNDVLFVTGTLGGSFGGRHLNFVPRIAEGRWLSSHGYARAMIDLSDGLATDLPRLAAASKCGFQIDSAALPKTRGCDSVQAMCDGEDYELLIAVDPRLATQLRRGWREMFPRRAIDGNRAPHRAGSLVNGTAQGLRSLFSVARSLRVRRARRRMIRIKYHAPGTPPATLVSHAEGEDRPAVVTLIQYNSDTIFEGQIETFEELMRRFDPSKVNWINVDGLCDVELLRKLGQQFNIHPLALEDVLNTTQRPKVEHYTDHYFIISDMIIKRSIGE